MKKKTKKRVVFLIILSIIVLLLLFVLTRKVVFVLIPEVPKEYIERLSLPKVFSSGSIVIRGKEETLEKFSRIKMPSLVIYTPFSEKPSEEYNSATWGVGERIKINEEDMYRYFLENNKDKTVAFLLDTLDTKGKEMYLSLKRDYPSLESVEYNERITSVNRDGILSSLSPFYAVIVRDVIATKDAWNNTSCRVVMRVENAASAMSVENIISITLDWNKIIKKLLQDDKTALSEYKIKVLNR